MKKIAVLFTCLSISFLHIQTIAADTIFVSSPDRSNKFALYLENDALHFKVSRNGIQVVKPSALVVTMDGKTVTENVRVGKTTTSKSNITYPVLGAHATARNQYNESFLMIEGNMNYQLIIRAFNDGVAFRFIFPGDQSSTRIPDESTVFNLPGDSKIWYHDMENHYESVHQKKEVAELSAGEWAAPPATYKLSAGFYAAITEADLRNYPGMSLLANGKNGLELKLAHKHRTSYPYRLRYSAEDTLRLLQPAAIKGDITTPWRVIIIGHDLNAFVNNDVVNNLCPSADKKLFPDQMSTSWIRPGRAVWKYLNGGGDGTLAVMKHFTDGAAALGFEHNILEGFWARWKEGELKELIEYSKKRGVGIWLWKHSKSLQTRAARDSFFTMCHSLGVTGVKLDFFDHEAKEVIDLYENILIEAAERRLMVDFHGANKPTGLARTYPNEMVREAVKGMETSRITDRATHETTIPFTRCIVGPAEYTVLHFGERRKNTTWTHQIASAAILHAPLLTYAANPDTILMNPAVEIIKKIPAVWDETIVLPASEIGEVAAFARRKGNDWFIAVMNGVKPGKLTIPLSFLKAGSYKASLVKDDPKDSASLTVTTGSYSSKDVMVVDLIPGGGFVAVFSK
jgi:alpha-glucosidase